MYVCMYVCLSAFLLSLSSYVFYFEFDYFIVLGDEAVERLLGCRNKDLYSILGVARNSTEEEIKKHYRKQAMLVHPDKVRCCCCVMTTLLLHT